MGIYETGSKVNDSAVNQSTANSAAGLAGSGLAPGEGINSFTGPGITEIDLGLERKFAVRENQYLTFKAQVFNLINTANYYVQAGGGINQVQYTPTGGTPTDASNSTCGDGKTLNQTCTLTPNGSRATGGFQTFESISQPNPPRIMQFALSYAF